MNSSEIVAINSMASSMPRLPVKVDGRSLISHMKNHPFYGFVDVSLPGGGSFIMINLNDCAVSSKIFWTGQFAYEPGSLSVWRHLSKTSGSIVDCGAYTGIYSLVSAAVNNASMIYAFEPVSFIRARLCKNAIINKFSKIKVFPCALGENNSIINLAIPFGPELFSSGTSIVSSKHSDTHEVVKVESFDDLGLPSPDLIKIDAEGAEDLVLLGMQKSFHNNPFVLCEVLGKRDPESLLTFLPRNYKYYYIKESGAKTLTNNYDDWRASGGLNVIYYHANKSALLNQYFDIKG